MNSPIVSSAEMRAAEEAAFVRGIGVETLMDAAGAGIARAVQQFFLSPGTCIVYAGKGHNGGDALVAANHLAAAGWRIELHLPFPERECSDLTRKKIGAVTNGNVAASSQANSVTTRTRNFSSIILDGLLGVGAKPPLRDPIRSAAREINRRRKEQNAYVFAIDLPTGLDSDSGESDEDCVRADFTIAIAYAKRGLVVDSALDLVGRIEVVPLASLDNEKFTPNELMATAGSLAMVLPRRDFSAYKNLFGRVGLVAGSEGFLGASILAAKGALRSGAGLVNMFVPRDLYSTVAALAPDEAMVKPVRSYVDLLQETNVDVWAVGPGLGLSRAGEVLEVVEQSEKPMVIDADGLNMVAKNPELLRRCKGPRLLTPHPGEMKRLFDAGKLPRADIARRFCGEYPVSLLFKGSRSIVCVADQPLSYNSTGNPGMATGGMGDVLTGVCAGLLAQKLTPYDAARVGSWLCGRAAELAVFQRNQSEESLLPRDIVKHLGAAFNDLRHPHI